MTKASDNAFPSVLITEGTEPSAPAAGKQRLYIDSTSHHLMRTNSSGTETDIEASAGGVATDSIWDAAGDLAVGTGANTAAKLSIGATNGMSVQRVSGSVAWALPPGYEFDYVESSTGASVTATTEATANTILTGSAVSYDGSTAVVIEWYSPTVRPDNGAAARQLSLWLYDGSSSIGEIGRILTPAANLSNHPVVVRRRLTPSNASHTYSIRGSVSAGTGQIGAGAGGAAALMPQYIRITKA